MTIKEYFCQEPKAQEFQGLVAQNSIQAQRVMSCVTELQHAQGSWGICIALHCSFSSQTFERCLMAGQDFLICGP